MPTYEYQCTKCNRVFELFQSITAKPKKWIECECDECDNRAPVIRLIGAGGGVLFKGDGFYQTDYRSDSYKQAAKAENESAAPATESKTNSGTGESKAKTKPKTGSGSGEGGSKSTDS